MIDLVEEAAKLQSFIEDHGWEFYFICGIVVQVWGRPRLTTDVDVTIFTNLVNEPEILQTILGKYKAKFSDADKFALTDRVLPVESSKSIGIDFTLGGFSDSSPQLQRATYEKFTDEISLKVCSKEDLIILKTTAWRPQDIFDIEGVIIKHDDLDWGYIEEQLTRIDEYQYDSDYRAKVEGLMKLRSQYSRR